MFSTAPGKDWTRRFSWKGAVPGHLLASVPPPPDSILPGRSSIKPNVQGEKSLTLKLDFK
jgi:hypothetical protein